MVEVIRILFKILVIKVVEVKGNQIRTKAVVITPQIRLVQTHILEEIKVVLLAKSAIDLVMVPWTVTIGSPYPFKEDILLPS